MISGKDRPRPGLFLVYLALGVLFIMGLIVHRDYRYGPVIEIDRQHVELPKHHFRTSKMAKEGTFFAHVRALERYPDAESCTVGDGTASAMELDWPRMANPTEAEVCLFRIFERLGSIDAVENWLNAQEMRPAARSETGFDGMRHVSWSCERKDPNCRIPFEKWELKFWPWWPYAYSAGASYRDDVLLNVWISGNVL